VARTSAVAGTAHDGRAKKNQVARIRIGAVIGVVIRVVIRVDIRSRGGGFGFGVLLSRHGFPGHAA
jgi:hypothetical protein